VDATSTLPAVRNLTDVELQSINTFDDALALMKELYGEGGLVSADQVMGNGFRILQGAEKDRLIDTPMMFLKWTLNPGKFGEEFVSALIVTLEGDKYIINDSGAGICKQLSELSAIGKSGGLVVHHGLRRSDYENPAIQDGTWVAGEWRSASTYYVDTTP
jgi:hypothetical protein